MAETGTFVLYLYETPLATLDYTWGRGGEFESRATFDDAGQKFSRTFRVTADATGRWTKLEREAPTGKTSISRDGLKLVVTHPKGTETMELAPGAVLFENYSPALMKVALRMYDEGKGGTQEIPIYVPGERNLKGKLTRHDDITRSLRGQDIVFGRWTFDIEGLEIELLSDPEGRIVYGHVAVQHATYVRGGYEPLLGSVEDDPKLSRPEHEVVLDDDLRVKMRDGVELSVDVYRPAVDGKYPTIVVRTPYKKESELRGRYFARRGYAFVVQDVRGRSASGGTWIPWVNEKKDGYDTIEWSAKQKWSTGKVGMIGQSYVGFVQWNAAVEQPPHLVTIIPSVSPPDPFYNIPYEYGVLLLRLSLWWADLVSNGALTPVSGLELAALGEKKYSPLLRSLPVIDLDKVILGRENKFWREWIAHPNNDSYWAGGAYLDALSKVNIPVFIQSGWFDGNGIGGKLAYARLAKLGRKNVKLVLGPWAHTATEDRKLDGLDFGPAAVSINLHREYLRWFDRWLKGIDNGIDEEPLVSIFEMGENRWLRGNTYPLEGTVMEKWHLSSGGKANTLTGDGKLGRDVAAGAETDSYVYDPGDPTSELSPYEEPERKADQPISKDQRKKGEKGYFASVLTNRKDFLVYTSEPFTEDTTFAGPVTGILYASTTAKDTDWFMTLTVIDAENKPSPAVQHVQGRLRARFRASSSRPELLTPGKVEKYELDMWQTGITVKKGERIRIHIASASFPRFSRNLNTGGHNETETNFVSATQTIHHSKEYPSHVLLPRIPAQIEKGKTAR